MEALHRFRISQWCLALEKGNYEQARYCLRDDNKYCVLGVAVDVMVKKGKGKWVKAYYFNPRTKVFTYELDGVQYVGNLVIPAIEEYFGLGSSKVVDANWGRIEVSSLNDLGVSFTELASLLRNTHLAHEFIEAA